MAPPSGPAGDRHVHTSVTTGPPTLHIVLWTIEREQTPRRDTRGGSSRKEGQHQGPMSGRGLKVRWGAKKYTGVTVCCGRLSACGEIPRDQGPAGRKVPSPAVHTRQARTSFSSRGAGERGGLCLPASTWDGSGGEGHLRRVRRRGKVGALGWPPHWKEQREGRRAERIGMSSALDATPIRRVDTRWSTSRAGDLHRSPAQRLSDQRGVHHEAPTRGRRRVSQTFATSTRVIYGRGQRESCVKK